MGTRRIQSTIEITAAQLAAWPAPTGEFDAWVQIVDLPNKPIFRHNGTMWVPLTGVCVLGMSAVAVSCPADATEDILATVNVPAGLLGLNGLLRVSAVWTCTNSANTKTPRLRYSGIGGTAYGSSVLTTVTSFRQQAQIANRGLANSQHGNDGAGGGFGTALSVTSAVDTTAATSLVITGQKQTLGETFTLESYLVEALPG